MVEKYTTRVQLRVTPLLAIRLTTGNSQGEARRANEEEGKREMRAVQTDHYRQLELERAVTSCAATNLSPPVLALLMNSE